MSGLEQAAIRMSPSRVADAQRIVDELRGNMVGFARLLRAQAEGARTSRTVRDALTTLSREPATAIALCYAELLLDGEIRVNRLAGRQRAENVTLRICGKLAAQRSELLGHLKQEHQRRLELADHPHSAPDYLDALVMRHVGGKPFGDALAAVLERRNLSPRTIDVPLSNWWESIAGCDPDLVTAEAQLPAEVRRVRSLDDDAFRRVLVADADGTDPADFLAHDAVVERWAAHAGQVAAQSRRERNRTEEELARTPLAERDSGQLLRLKHACDTYARAGARALTATLLAQDLQVRAIAFHRRMPAQQVRAERLFEASEELAETDPELWDTVRQECAAHRARCPRVNDPHPCFDCAGPIAAAIKRRIGRRRPEPKPEPANVPAPATEPAAAPGTADRNVSVETVPAALKDSVPNVQSTLVSRLACEAALRGLNPEVTRTVVVVETWSDADADVYGFAWLAEDGELRTGTERSSSPYGNAIQAMCLAALEVYDGVTPVHVVCRNEKAASVLVRALRSGSLRDPADALLTRRTRQLLAEVARHRKRISAAWDPCPQPHPAAATIRQLAGAALQAARGPESRATAQPAANHTPQKSSRGAGAEPAGREEGSKLTSPEEEHDHISWRPGGEPRPGKHVELVWHAPLYRVHLRGGWCPLPPGRIGQAHDGRQLYLKLNHQDRHSQPGPEHAVTLRRRGGQWELHGIRWPTGLRPGVIVTFAWKTAGPRVAARTALLRKPERIDGVEFLHWYDARVVTREAAPGFDQDRNVPDLPDVSWVLLTLRKLGYLSPDGSATLAEDALARNCERLGVRRSQLNRLPAAVEQLVRSGRIQRVRGSLDRYGRPWYPALTGQVPAELLRYVPSIETSGRSARQIIEDAWPAQRDTHSVSPFVRRLPPGAQASADQIDLHQQAVENAEVVDQRLPEGYTFVRRHRRG